MRPRLRSIAASAGAHRRRARGGIPRRHGGERPPPAKPLAKVTLQWVGDMAMSTERGLPPGGVYNALAPVHGLLKARRSRPRQPGGDPVGGGHLQVRGRDRRLGRASPSRPRPPPPASYGGSALAWSTRPTTTRSTTGRRDRPQTRGRAAARRGRLHRPARPDHLHDRAGSADGLPRLRPLPLGLQPARHPAAPRRW